MTEINFLFNDANVDKEKKQDTPIFLFAHGAGAPMDSEFMNFFAQALAKRDVDVIRFEFSYMQQRRIAGGRKPPDSQARLLERWRQVIKMLAGRIGNRPLFMGGKSMGGRIASMLLADLAVEQPETDAMKLDILPEICGCVCLGYPFHPVAKRQWQEKRMAHLAVLSKPVLILQGERDAMGDRAFISQHCASFSCSVRIHELPDGNHDLVPRKASGLTKQDNFDTAVEVIVDFMLQEKRAARA